MFVCLSKKLLRSLERYSLPVAIASLRNTLKPTGFVPGLALSKAVIDNIRNETYREFENHIEMDI